MDIVCDKKGTGTLVRVNGRLDAVNAPVFEKECMQVIDGGETMMVIDLSELEYISSAGLRSILSAAKKLKGTGGTMQFCGLTGMVEEVFKVSGLGTMFTVTDTADEAFAS